MGLRLDIEEDGKRRAVRFTQPELTIGRGPDNIVVINDPRSSRHHLKISRTPQGLLLEDLESRNGTLLNGSAVKKSFVKPGDEFRIGNTRFLLADESAALASTGAAPRDSTAEPSDGEDILEDGPPYAAAESLFALAKYPTIYLKLTPRIFGDVKKGSASAESFFPRLVEAFGSKRLAWGSNYPTSEGALIANLDKAKGALKTLSKEDQAWIFGKTAQVLYPRLAD